MLLGAVGLRGGLALRCLGGPFIKKSLGLLIGDIPLILPGPMRNCPPDMYIGLIGVLGLIVGTIGVCAVLIEFCVKSLACDSLDAISTGLRTFNDFDSSKFDFWTSALLESLAFSCVIISSFFISSVHSSEATVLHSVFILDVADHVELVEVFVCLDIVSIIG